MKLSDLLMQMQKVLQNGDAMQVLASLRQDKLVWQTVQTSDLIINNLSLLSQPEFWRPGYLALLALGLDTKTIKDLLKDPANFPDETLKEKAIQFYKDTIHDGSLKQPLTLAEAGLLAMALLERGLASGSWAGLAKEIGLDQAGALEIWATPIACLFGYMADPEPMLLTLLNETDFQTALDLISNAVFSNLQKRDEGINTFITLLEALPLDQKLTWLRFLNLKGEKGISQELADKFLQTSLPGEYDPEGFNADDWDSEALLKRALSNQQLAALYQLSGQPESAVRYLKDVQKAAAHYFAGINLDLLENDKNEEALEATAKLIKQSEGAIKGSKQLQTKLDLMVGTNPQSTALQYLTPDQSQSPYVKIQKAARAAELGNLESAASLAREAADGLMQLWDKDNPFKNNSLLSSWEPVRFIQILQSLGLNQAAWDVTQLFLQTRPNDNALIETAAALADHLGDPEKALNYGLMGLMFDENNIQNQRRVAELFEIQDDFNEALKHRRKVLELDEDVKNPDWLACAKCALEVEDYLQVVEACNKVVENEPDNAEAATLLGQSLYYQGETEAAEIYLKKATQLSPKVSKNWLTLADIYRKNNTQAKLFETLRSAILSHPESAEINYELAQTCLEQGKMADALPFLRKAAGLAPESVKLAMKLGDTLRSMGYLNEACQALQNARQKFPLNADLALDTAKTLILLGESKAALAALEVVLQRGNPGFDEYMMYLKALFGDQSMPITPIHSEPDLSHLIDAQKILNKALEIKPDDFYARVLKAEILAAKGELEQAFECYQGIVDHPNATIPDWQGRIFGGFGKVALSLNEIETALAVLKEAAKARPDNIFLQRTLAEAFVTANLLDEAGKTAYDVLKIAPTNLQNLTWYADMAIQLDEENEAITALNTVVELDPDSADSWIKLADTQIKLGRLDDAHQATKSLIALDNLTVENWRQAAALYLRQNDQSAAISCIDQAIQIAPERAEELYFDLACLQKYFKNYKPALDSLQKAILISPQERIHYVLEADLMMAQGRDQAALACLAKALKLTEPSPQVKIKQLEQFSAQNIKMLPKNWFSIAQSDAGVHVRFAYLMRKMGSWIDALEHAEKAVELNPEQLSYRYLAADLANSQLDREKAAKLLEWIEDPQQAEGLGTLKKFKDQNLDVIISSAAQWAEQALDLDAEALAGRIVQQLIGLAQDNARVIANQVRLLARQGQSQTAKEMADKISGQAQILNENEPSVVEDFSGMDLVNSCQKGRKFWLGDALMEIDRYEEALNLFEASAANEADGLANLELARVLVIGAEKQRLMKELKTSTHAPGAKMLSKENLMKFEKAIGLAVKIHHSPEVELWLLRGKTVFNPSPHNLRLLGRLLENGGNVAPLVAALRQTGNKDEANVMAQKLGDFPEDLLQGALCLQDEAPEKGLLLIQKALENRSNNPLFNSAIALLSEKAGQIEKAFKSLELALGIWGDEPDWHAWAARLAQQAAPEKMLPHLEMAYQIQPTNIDFAHQLGKVYLNNESPEKALDIFKLGVENHPDNADLWSGLARAYESLKQIPEAYRSSEKAVSLSPSSVQNLLLCGQLAMQAGNSDAASAYAGEALRIEPQNEDVVVFASQAHAGQGNMQKGLNIIEKALQTNPGSFKIKLEQAQLTRHLNKSDESLALAKELGEQFPYLPEPLALTAEIENEKGNLNEAKQAALESLKINKQQPALLKLLGHIMHLSGQLDQAVDYLCEAINQAPQLIEAYIELGETYLERREPQEALKIYQQGIQNNPDQTDLYVHAAVILRDLKNYVGAEGMLRKAADLSPKDLNIRRQLGAVIALNLVHNSQEANSQL